MGKLTGYPVVDAIAQINFEGDITPKSWYKHIRYQNKKSGERADHLAVAILADIVYWYRPFQKRDEITGEVIGWFKKFKGDVLHRSPDAFAEALGTTTRCIRESIRLLENLGLIVVVLKPVKTQYGTIPNVMHIEIVPDAIAKITYRSASAETAESIEKSLLTKWVTSSDEISNKQSRNRKQPATKSSPVTTNSASQSHDFDNSSIDIDFLEINEISLQERGAEIELNSNTKDSNPESIAPLAKNPESSGKQITSLEGNFSAAAPRVNATRQYTKPPVEPFGRPRPSGKDYFWAWLPEGDWVVNGELDPKFWDWMATSWVNNPDFKTTYPKAKADVINHFTNRPQQLPLKWNEYCIEKLGKEAFTPLPDAVRSWQQVQHLLIWEQYNNCKDLEHFYSLRSWNRAYLEYALENLPNFDWSKHLNAIAAQVA